MYKIYADAEPLFHPYIENVKLSSAKIALKQNDIGSFNFTMNYNHPLIDKIQNRKTVITVFRDDHSLFRGVPITSQKTFKNAKTVQCKEYPYFLTYSVQRPYEYSGTVKGFLTMVINNHNTQVDAEQRFTVGIVDSDIDPNDYITRSDTTYLNTWDTIKKKLLDLLGGYLRFRYVNGIQYIDYVKAFDSLNTQEVQFGQNLLDLTTKTDSLDVFTVIVPVGATDSTTQQRVTIASVNDGKDFIEDAEAIKKFGRIVKTVTWNDVHDPQILLTKGFKELQNSCNQIDTIKLKAVDLANINKDISWFEMGKYIHAVSSKNSADMTYLPMEMQIDPFNPSQNSITLNASRTSMTDSIIKAESSASDKIDQIGDTTSKIIDEKLVNYYTQTETDGKITANNETLKSEISQTYATQKDLEQTLEDANGNTTELLKSYYTKTETDSQISQESDNIQSSVSEKYTTIENLQNNINDVRDYTNEALTGYVKNDDDTGTSYKTVVEQLSNVKQQANNLEISFTTTKQDITSNSTAIGDAQTRLSTIEDHVIITGDGIELKGTGTEFSSKFTKEKLQFLQSGAEVAYLSNSKLYITNAEVLTSIVIGKFAFIPRKDNGSLDFKKVG